MSKKLRLVLLVVAVVVLFVGCDFSSNVGTGDIEAGEWNGNVFTNRWSGLKVTMPSGYTSLNKTQMQELFGSAEEILINDKGLKEKDFDKAKTRSLYDFMIKFGDNLSNISLSYENLSLLGEEISVDDYFNKLKSDLESITSMNFSFASKVTDTVAGEEYTCAYFTVNEGQLYQAIYMRKIEDVMILIIATYTADTKDEMHDFVGSFEKA